MRNDIPRPRLTFTLLGLILAATTSALAQAPAQPGQPEPAGQAGQPLLKNSGQTDEHPDAATFVDSAAQLGLTEIDLSKLALQKSSNDDIKQYANTLIADFTKANTELFALAKKKGMKVSNTLDTDSAATVKAMSGESGKNFDIAYVKEMVTDHDEAISVFQSETTNADHDLADFAQRTLKVLQAHRRAAAKLPTQ